MREMICKCENAIRVCSETSAFPVSDNGCFGYELLGDGQRWIDSLPPLVSELNGQGSDGENMHVTREYLCVIWRRDK